MNSSRTRLLIHRPCLLRTVACRLSVILLGYVVAAYAEDASSPSDPGASATQHIHDELQQTLVRLAADGEMGSRPQDFSLSLDMPAHRVSNLGLLVDSTSADAARAGLRVLGTTPGSASEKLGLRPGDIVTSVNGASLRGLGADSHGRALAASSLRAAVEALDVNANLQLDVQRGAEALTLHTQLANVEVPAVHLQLGTSNASLSKTEPNATGCGRISTFDVAPRGEHLYAAQLLMLDGVTPGSLRQTSYRVSAGQHRLLVAEDIPGSQLGGGDFSTLRGKTHKELIVTIKPDTTLMLAAQLHADKTGNLMTGNYWEPIIWKETAEGCP